MKYLVLCSFEVDGHSSSNVVITSSSIIREKYIKDLINDLQAKNIKKFTDENGYDIMYGEYSCGLFSIKVIPFKAYKDITNKEFETFTG